MPTAISLCIERLGAGTDLQRFLRCVAVRGTEPGLGITSDGTVAWRDSTAIAAELWVSADDRLILLRPDGAPNITVSRAGRSLAVPHTRPVVLADRDELAIGGACLRLHIHGPAVDVHPPTLFLPEPAVRGRLTTSAAATALALGAAASGAIEVRSAPPKLAMPNDGQKHGPPPIVTPETTSYRCPTCRSTTTYTNMNAIVRRLSVVRAQVETLAGKAKHARVRLDEKDMCTRCTSNPGFSFDLVVEQTGGETNRVHAPTDAQLSLIGKYLLARESGNQDDVVLSMDKNEIDELHGALGFDVSVKFLCNVCSREWTYSGQDIRKLRPLALCRREMKALLKVTPYPVSLDESMYCNACPKTAEDVLPRLVTELPGKKRHVAHDITPDDIRLLTAFLSNKATFTDTAGRTVKVSDRRLRAFELAGIPGQTSDPK